MKISEFQQKVDCIVWQFPFSNTFQWQFYSFCYKLLKVYFSNLLQQIEPGESDMLKHITYNNCASCLCVFYIHTTPCFSGIKWLISILSSSSLSSVSPLSSPRAPPSIHSDRQQEDRQQQQSSGEFCPPPQNWHTVDEFDIRETCFVSACSRVISYYSGDSVGGPCQWNFGEGGAGDT